MKNKNHLLLMLAIFCLTNLQAQDNHSGYPSDVLSYFEDWKITLGDGSTVNNLIDYEHEDYFYNTNDGNDWVVYKTPNSGGTTPNSSNTRSELRQYDEWTPETGGKLTGSLKVMHVSTTGNAMVPASFSVVVGQIHSSEGHENEPLKIFYKKFPGHEKGSVFWNYEINTEGDNDERWDYSTAVWGYDWSVVGSDSSSYPEEPEEGIALGEEFSYEVNINEGIMYLTFTSENLPTKTFIKSLTTSDFSTYESIPSQVLSIFESTGQDGTEQANAYAGESQYFKQGAYNQTNGKDPADNMIWNTGAQTYNGDVELQYANGSYAEVWFKAASLGEGTAVDSTFTKLPAESAVPFIIYPNPASQTIHIETVNKLKSYALYNISGQNMLAQSSLADDKLSINISALKSGHYILMVEDLKQKTYYQKILKP